MVRRVRAKLRRLPVWYRTMFFVDEIGSFADGPCDRCGGAILCWEDPQSRLPRTLCLRCGRCRLAVSWGEGADTERRVTVAEYGGTGAYWLEGVDGLARGPLQAWHDPFVIASPVDLGFAAGEKFDEGRSYIATYFELTAGSRVVWGGASPRLWDDGQGDSEVDPGWRG